MMTEPVEEKAPNPVADGETAEASEATGPEPESVEKLSAKNKTLEEELAKLKLQQEELNEQLSYTKSAKEKSDEDFKDQIQDLRRQIIESRRAKEQSDREVQSLSQEIEDLSEKLFSEANNQVKEANIESHNIKKRNERLIEALTEKDSTIELLKGELNNLKTIINNLEDESKSVLSRRPTDDPSSVESLGDASFKPSSLQKYNGKQIYTPIFNQLRFDLAGFISFKRALQLSQAGKLTNVKDSSFFKQMITEEIEPTLRLDLSPSVKFYQRKTFINNLMEYKVTIAPLSASTEVWKNAASPSMSEQDKQNKRSSRDLRMFKYETDQPVAVESKCSICGEDRKDMNFARLYKMTIREHEYLLCISCSLKLRRLIDLLNYIKNLQPTTNEEEVIKHWLAITNLRAKLYFTKLGTWDDTDDNGLVYGWKNAWIAQQPDDNTNSKINHFDEETPLSKVPTRTGYSSTNGSAPATPILESSASIPAPKSASSKEQLNTKESELDGNAALVDGYAKDESDDDFNDANEH